MISIIICSRTQTISNDLFNNIKNTIGYEYELIIIDNSENTYSIFEAYNLGIEKSVGEYLCFVHDDILFHTGGWGIVIQRIFDENKKLGLLGVAGAKTKTKIPSVWWDCPQENRVMNIIQHYPDKEKEIQNIGFEKKSIQKAVVIDGVFMVMRKDKNICFSTEMKGFHNYDLNISFECIKNGHEVMITNEILIEHFSIGTINRAWVDSAYKIHNLYKVDLPLSIWKNKTNEKLELDNAIRFINKCLDCNKNKMAISIWVSLFIVHPISKYHYRFWKRIIKNGLC